MQLVLLPLPRVNFVVLRLSGLLILLLVVSVYVAVLFCIICHISGGGTTPLFIFLFIHFIIENFHLSLSLFVISTFILLTAL